MKTGDLLEYDGNLKNRYGKSVRPKYETRSRFIKIRKRLQEKKDQEKLDSKK